MIATYLILNGIALIVVAGLLLIGYEIRNSEKQEVGK